MKPPISEETKSKKLKTKADMLERIKNLEECIDRNNRLHASAMDSQKYSFICDIASERLRINDKLFDILLNGTKGETFPRRS